MKKSFTVLFLITVLTLAGCKHSGTGQSQQSLDSEISKTNQHIKTFIR